MHQLSTPLPPIRSEIELQQLAQALATPFFAEALFDQLDDVVFFVKDAGGRYRIVNETLMRRCGCRQKSEIVGRTPLEVFPPELGACYVAQDQHVIRSGQVIQNQLELHLYLSRAPGWCLTYKIPLFDHQGHIVGLTGISRDLRMPDKGHPVYQRVADVVTYIQNHYQQPLKIEQLAQIAHLSVAQFERYMQRIFDLTPKQLIIKTRLQAATQLLKSNMSIVEIAYSCGYTDHSAFSRQFKMTVGISPSQYRSLLRQTRWHT
ncbi:AraC-like DNA-binding protein [Thermosporothrix hazakensis]|uniref:AraC-like DNA-binding protein n=1 Tax=Thermosporothrix hazakensis TaxID=644383 RepID=A0A326U7I0_THEHA|nr:AraC family transcriptional regulator [Thermosporothrix hazakensis]PZW29239.1 AraC-like DNA-binding protein [Thermosporothrix hazakensis]GCE45409.1 AraC family transcriptional regulator [Thermosporothrix hazakensis]